MQAIVVFSVQMACLIRRSCKESARTSHLVFLAVNLMLYQADLCCDSYVAHQVDMRPSETYSHLLTKAYAALRFN